MQTALSRSGAESEIISLDAGLRMKGIPSITIMGLRLGNIFIFQCKKNLNRQSSDRHSHFHSDENTSF